MFYGFDDREFGDESLVPPDIILGVKEVLYDEGVDEYLEAVFRVMRMYFDAARKEFLNEDIAKEMMLMAYQRWLEEGRLL